MNDLFKNNRFCTRGVMDRSDVEKYQNRDNHKELLHIIKLPLTEETKTYRYLILTTEGQNWTVTPEGKHNTSTEESVFDVIERPKYKFLVDVTRCVRQDATLEVYAYDKDDAEELAEEKACDEYDREVNQLFDDNIHDISVNSTYAYEE